MATSSITREYPTILDTHLQGVRAPISRTFQFSRSTANTPNYRKLLVEGKHLPTNAYSIRKRVTTHTNGSFADRRKSDDKVVGYWRGGQESYLEAHYFGQIPVYEPTEGEKTGVYNSAVNKVLQQLKEQRINIGQAFAERQQTVRLVATNLRRIALGIGAIRKGNWAALRKELGLQPTPNQVQLWRRQQAVGNEYKGSGQLWLELQYGWKPLLSDVFGAMEVFESPLPSIQGTVRGRAKATLGATVRKDSTYFKQQTRSTCIIKREIGVQYSLSETDLALFTRSAADLGLTNPVCLAWELLPFSFVIDWFLPVGNYLSSLDATFGLTFKQGWYSDKWVRTSSRVVVGAGRPGGSTVYTTGAGFGRYEEEWFARSNVKTFPSPFFPRLKDPLSATHVANALALLITNLRSKT